MKEIETAILDIFIEVCARIYNRRLTVVELKEGDIVYGYKVSIPLSSNEYPLTLACSGTKEEFLNYVRKEIKARSWGAVTYSLGYKSEPDDKQC